MNKYFVHIYHSVRSKFAVEAESHEEAMKKADELLPEACKRLEYDRIGCVNTERDIARDRANLPIFFETHSAEEVTGYLVDELDDTEYQNSVNYDAAGRPNIGETDYGMSQRERDTVLAALRVFDAWRCGEPIDREMIVDIETNGGKHPSPGLSAPELDALCERINR